MIKLNHIPEQVMDVIMTAARQSNKQPEEVIKIMLSLVDLEDIMKAMRAINNEQYLQGQK